MKPKDALIRNPKNGTLKINDSLNNGAVALSEAPCTASWGQPLRKRCLGPGGDFTNDR